MRGPQVKLLVKILRFLVSLSLVVWLLTAIDVAASLRLLESARVSWLAAAVATLLAVHGVNCLRWRWCLLDQSRHVHLRTLVVSYWTSLFVGLTLPTEYGGDLLRIRDVESRLESRSAAIASVLWSRITGIGATLLLFSLTGLMTFERLVEFSMVWVWAICCMVCIALAAILFVRPAGEIVTRLLTGSSEDSMPGPSSLRGGVLSILLKVREIAIHPAYAWRIGALALLSQALLIATNCFYAWALGLPVTALDMALIVPLVTLSATLPISIAGIGVKEGVFVVFLGALGVPGEIALSVALLKRLILLLFALTGGILFLFRRRLLENRPWPDNIRRAGSPPRGDDIVDRA